MIDYNQMEKMHNFRIHACGDYVVITAKSPDKINNYTFLATASIIKHILCTMNKKIHVSSLSKCQFSNIILALKSINCDFKLLSINNELIITSKSKVKKNHKVKVKIKK